MTEKVPMMETGRARLGITVAEKLRRKRKITRMTRQIAKKSVNLTSRTDSRMDMDRSKRMSMEIEAGSWARKVGRIFMMSLTTSTVLVPGWRWTAKTMARVSLNQLATLSFSTLSITLPNSCRRTGWPFR